MDKELVHTLIIGFMWSMLAASVVVFFIRNKEIKKECK